MCGHPFISPPITRTQLLRKKCSHSPPCGDCNVTVLRRYIMVSIHNPHNGTAITLLYARKNPICTRSFFNIMKSSKLKECLKPQRKSKRRLAAWVRHIVLSAYCPLLSTLHNFNSSDNVNNNVNTLPSVCTPNTCLFPNVPVSLLSMFLM